ncbi:MAG: hypothetical protein FP811_11845 [Desulfobacteraceae bacterium]|nr:hypothetical protein [Desulfobacteraceae bacterium]
MSRRIKTKLQIDAIDKVNQLISLCDDLESKLTQSKDDSEKHPYKLLLLRNQKPREYSLYFEQKEELNKRVTTDEN